MVPVDLGVYRARHFMTVCSCVTIFMIPVPSAVRHWVGSLFSVMVLMVRGVSSGW